MEVLHKVGIHKEPQEHEGERFGCGRNAKTDHCTRVSQAESSDHTPQTHQAVLGYGLLQVKIQDLRWCFQNNLTTTTKPIYYKRT